MPNHIGLDTLFLTECQAQLNKQPPCCLTNSDDANSFAFAELMRRWEFCDFVSPSLPPVPLET